MDEATRSGDPGHDKKRPDIHDLPWLAVTMMLRMPEHGDFPRVIVDMEPFRKWPKNRRPKEVTWIIPAREDLPKQTVPSARQLPMMHLMTLIMTPDAIVRPAAGRQVMLA